MAPNTSSVFNEAPPQSQQPESKASDAGVLVVAPTPPSSVPTPVEPASVPVSAAAAASVVAATGASTSATTTALSTAVAAAAAAASPATALASALRVDECGAGCFRRRRRQLDAEQLAEMDRDAIARATAAEDAAALAASERHFQQQLQMSRFARVSPAALDGIKPSLGFRKSCLKRSNSELPADLSALKHEAVTAAAQNGAVTASELPAAPMRPVQKNRRRCWECKVKVGLTAVTCRCDYTFCNKHRYAEEHKCSFDFKVSAKRKLEEENPRVVPVKIARIN